jgi:hypothetical protein
VVGWVSTTVAGVTSALAPNLAVLIAARALAGGLFAAVIPASSSTSATPSGWIPGRKLSRT